MLHEWIHEFARTVGVLIDGVSVVIVAYGAVECFIRLLLARVNPRTSHGALKAIWRRLGLWLVLGLEFMLAADIVGSVVAPTWEDIGELAAIAVIRTFLNFFLERDLENAARETAAPRERELAP